MNMQTNMYSLITSFFSVYLPNTVGCSENTIKSYRDTFILLFKYSEEKHLCPKGKINISLFDKVVLSNFLEWLETERNASISTRNQRLAALKTFAKYASYNSVENMDLFQGILELKVKKSTSKTVDYLSTDAVALLLQQPDTNSRSGIRDLAMLSLLYETGARVQELIDIKVGDISATTPTTLKLIGKGRKVRIIPISIKVASIVRKYLSVWSHNNTEDFLFTNRCNSPLTRSGVTYILKKYAEKARKINPELIGNTNIHPHVLRHSKAMHLLESGVNLIYIRDFLGHSSVTTTEIYARSNPEIKRKYLEKAAINIDASVDRYSEKEKETLMQWLKNNI